MNTQLTTAEITYKAVGDYFIPEIGWPESTGPIGHFGRLRKAYLQKHRPLIFQLMLLEGTLNDHLAELNRRANERREALIRQMAANEGVDENLKAADQMTWVQSMNSICSRAEEIILHEMIYGEGAI